LRDILSEPGYRERAAALATAWAARPGPAAAVEALQRRIARSSG
jgi:hypothetical protein